MSSRPDSKAAFVSFTLKLKDKLHPQWIRRSEPIKQVSPPRLKTLDLDQATSAGVLVDRQRAVVSSLQYFKALVDRLGLDRLTADGLGFNQSVLGGLLGGASTRVLEAVQTLVQLEPQLSSSETVSSCLTRLYQSVAQLIRWADQVMLRGVTQDDSAPSVTMVIRVVLDSVKELVKLAAERQEGSTPLSPVQSQPAVGRSGASEEQETTSTCRSPGAPEEQQQKDQEVLSAPPKPPMPSLEPRPPELRPPEPHPPSRSPPALPPKKRHSSSGPLPCKVAIVAPMRREPEADKQEEGDECVKCSSTADTHCEEDPDYDFLHTDLSSSESLPPLPQHASLPPALPQKTRRSTAGGPTSETSASFGFDSTSQEDGPSHSDDVTGPEEPLSCPLSPSRTPPPLPEKKRHIDQYMKLCSASYGAQSPARFYERPLTFGQRSISRQREVDISYELSQTHLDPPDPPDPSNSPEQLPVLPPKKRQQDEAEDEGHTEENLRPDSSQSRQQEAAQSQRSREQQEELLLTNQQDILSRITMKSEEEEGPDVKAASPDVLLVYATETDGASDLYREAFLSTYRSFLSPDDIITKLQHRYPLTSPVQVFRPHLSTSDHIRPHLSTSDPTCPHQTTSVHIRPHQSTSDPTCPHQSTSVHIRPHLSRCSDLTCPHQTSPVNIRPHLSTSDPTCPHQTTSDHISPHQTTSDLTCPHQTSPVHIRPHLSTSDLTCPHQTSPVHIRPHQTTSDLTCPGVQTSPVQVFRPHLTPAHLTAAKKTFHLLVTVVDELCAVELDSDLLLLLMELVQSLLIGGELALANLLRANILSKMEQRWQLIGSPQDLRPLAAKGVAARPGTLLDFRSQDLAEQLTLLDSGLFYKIELPEVLLWSKEQNEEKSPNLTQFTQHFNNVSFWVRSVVILQDKAQDREKLLLKFLKVMKHLRKLNNFNSYLSILSALDSAPLRRLDWQRSTAEALEEYSSLIDSSSSFRAYRAALAEADPPCIPYLGLILQDLTFVHLGNPDMLTTSQSPKVNFSKRWQQFNILDTLRSYQQVRYSIQPDDDITSFFNDFSDHLAEEALWELSLRLRPRNVPRAALR
ncbi:uncharacterized protein V6R79_021747 [Siganus canaliculatus]